MSLTRAELASHARHAPRNSANSTRPSSPGRRRPPRAPRRVDVVERRIGLAEQASAHHRGRDPALIVGVQPELFAHGLHDARDEARVLHRQRDAHRVGFRRPSTRAAPCGTGVRRSRVPDARLMLTPHGAMTAAAEERVDEPVERILRAHASFWTSSNMRAVQPAISTGGRSSVTIRSAIAFSSRRRGRVGVGEHDRRAGVAVLRHRGLDRHRADERRAGERGEALAAARTEDRVARAVGRDELGHVLDDAEHLQVRAARHVGDARRHLLRADRRRRDDEHLGLRQQARQRHLDVARSRGHVDQQVVEVAPADVDEELLERLGEDEARAT